MRCPGFSGIGDCEQGLVATHVFHESIPYLWISFWFKSDYDVSRVQTYLKQTEQATINISVTFRSVPLYKLLRNFVPHI